MKKKLTILLAIAMMSTMITACGAKDDNSSTADNTTVAEDTQAEETKAEESETEAQEEETTEAATEAQVLVLPEGATAEDGDAYLAFGDSQWWLQYGGKDGDNLSYGAEVVHIDGDGTYTVSLDASNPDAVGMNGLDTITGCSFCAIVIQNGEELFPDQATSITIDSIKLDGNEVEFTKNYCNYEDGNLRTNIFNSYVPTAPTEDVWTADGDLTDISAQIVPASTFDTPFSKIEVTFTISGSSAEGDADAGDDAEGDAEANAEDNAESEVDNNADADTNADEESAE